MCSVFSKKEMLAPIRIVCPFGGRKFLNVDIVVYYLTLLVLKLVLKRLCLENRYSIL